uniref:Uncharacterized protein n=1 Tax=Romanomermis culicivorax TaxID=13658 RepID=A0A915HRN4_ROMCU
MKITPRVGFAVSRILSRRGIGFLEGNIDTRRSVQSMERRFSKMLLNTVGLTVVNKYPNALESFAATIVKRPKKLKASLVSSNQAKIYANVLMEHVQQILQSGELSQLAADLNVTINKAELDSKFIELKLHWNAKGTAEDQDTQQTLNRLAPMLKQIISQMNIVGRSPRIIFIANYTQQSIDMLNEKFQQLDLPKDYKPFFDPNLFPSRKFADTTLSVKNDYDMQTLEEKEAKS